MTEQDEQELLNIFNIFSVDSIDNESTEKSESIKSVSVPAAIESSFSYVRSALPISQQLAITDIARQHGLDDTDPLWALVAAMQIHANYSKEIPAELSNAGNQVARQIEVKITEIRKIVGQIVENAEEAQITIKTAAESGAIQAMDAAISRLKDESTDIINTISNDVAIKTVENALNQMTAANLTSFNQIKISSEKSAAAAAQALIVSEKSRWAKLGLTAAGAIAIIGMIAGAGIMYFFQPPPTASYQFTGQLSSMVECNKTSQTQILCKLKG